MWTSQLFSLDRTIKGKNETFILFDDLLWLPFFSNFGQKPFSTGTKITALEKM